MQMLTSMTKFATRRDYSLDTIKALATICVVFVHASNLYGYSNSESLLINQIYGFFGKFAALGVPLFFVVSGYLASMQYQPGFVWYKENLKKKTKTLAVPYLTWILVYFVLQRIVLGAGDWNDMGSILYDLFGVPFVWSPIYAPLWFVRDLYLLTILLPLIKKIIQAFAPPLIICTLLWLFLEPSVFYEFRSCLWYFLGILIQSNNARLERVCFEVDEHLTVVVLGEGILLILSILWSEFWLQQAVITVGVVLVWLFFRSPQGREKRILGWMRRWIFPASFSVFVLHGKILSLMQIVWAKCFGAWDMLLLTGYFLLPALTIIICIVIDTLLRKTPVYIFLTGNRT